jgi:hypothetical protein
MQIPSVPPPIVTSNSVTQDVVAKAVPVVQVAAPLSATAVTQAPKSEKSNQNRGSKDKERDPSRKENRDHESGDDKRGGSVNMSV